MRRIAADFAAAKSLIEEKAAEFGIELTPPTAAEWSKYKNAEKDFIEGQQFTKLTEKYCKEPQKILENTDDRTVFAPLGTAEREEMLAVIRRNRFFIAAKIRRAFHGSRISTAPTTPKNCKIRNPTQTAPPSSPSSPAVFGISTKTAERLAVRHPTSNSGTKN